MDNKKIVNNIIKCIDKIITYTNDIDYDGVEIQIIWDTIKADLPKLKEQLKQI